ncbi:MAG: 23S rRNA (pseudouridine(1915)-N(3))-methyltransferase RlmH [Clostridia bacterium]|nr:23S rRNA (pseudouridine(1915)-N(3))-methyltransferase RlmH [Clostridia bacterium]
MVQLTLIAVGSLKESYLREAAAEYKKRLSAFCKLTEIELKEHKLPEDPTEKEIASALSAEGKEILAAVPPKAYKIALCVEGKRFTSPAFAEKLGEIFARTGEVAFIIGSSHGLSEEVKQAADLSLSVSDMTFPHQLFRVMLLEILYRSFQIRRGGKYHK